MKKLFTNPTDNICLLDFLSDNIELVSKSQLQKQLKLKEVKVNGVRISKNIILSKGDEVEIFLPAAVQKQLNAPIVYSDENILVVHKPVMCDVENHLTKFFKEGREFCLPVHRLDRNTTGLVIFALNQESYQILLDAFKAHAIDKYYSALVWGTPSPQKATLTAFLKTDKQKKLSIVDIKPFLGASKIITEYEVMQKYENYSKLQIKLITGKTHQIRAHMAFIGHPVLGDGKYGNNQINNKFGYKFQKLNADKIVFLNLDGKLSYLSGKEIKFIID